MNKQINVNNKQTYVLCEYVNDNVTEHQRMPLLLFQFALCQFHSITVMITCYFDSKVVIMNHWIMLLALRNRALCHFIYIYDNNVVKQIFMNTCVMKELYMNYRILFL